MRKTTFQIHSSRIKKVAISIFHISTLIIPLFLDCICRIQKKFNLKAKFSSRQKTNQIFHHFEIKCMASQSIKWYWGRSLKWCCIFFVFAQFCRYYAVLLRRNYVTPTSYLELIKTFKSLLGKKRFQILTLKTRYLKGLEKLDFASSQVSMTSLILTSTSLGLTDLREIFAGAA